MTETGWMRNYQLGDVRRMATSSTGSLEGLLEARRELARRGKPVPALPEGLALYAQLAGRDVVHVRQVAGLNAMLALCGAKGELLGEIVADERAVMVSRRNVCRHCITHRERALALRADRSNVPNPETDDAGETGEKEARTMATATATKAASKELIDVKKYATTSEKKLVDERTTINNRISGVKTQLKRLEGQRGVADRKKELKSRLDDLTNRRTLIAAQLASRTAAAPGGDGNAKLAAATKEAATSLAAKSRSGARKSGTARRK